MLCLLFHGIAGDDATEADEEIDFARGFEIGNTIADHDGGFWQHRLFPLANDLRFAAVAGGGVVRAVTSVISVRIVLQWHGLDEGNA